MDSAVSVIDNGPGQLSYFVLYHYDAAGAINRERLLAGPARSSSTTYHLINDATKETSSTVQERASSDYSIARLELHKTHVVLSVFQEIDSGSWILPSRTDEKPFRVPVSSESSNRLVILRHGDHFTTSSGRWSVTLMKDPLPKFWHDMTNNATEPRLPTTATVSRVSVTSNEDNDPDDQNDCRIQRQDPTEKMWASEAMQMSKTDVTEQFIPQDSISTTQRLGSAVNSMSHDRPVSTLSITQTITIAQEGDPNSKAAIVIHTDSQCENVPQASNACQGQGHLKQFSVNLPSKADFNDQRGDAAKKPCRKFFLQQSNQTISKEVGSPEWINASKSVPSYGKAVDSPALDARNENGRNDGIDINMKQPASRRRIDKTYTVVRSTLASKKRKGDAWPQPLDEYSDITDVVSRSTKQTESTESKSSGKVASLAQTFPVNFKSKRATSFKPYEGLAPKVLFSSSTTVDSKNEIMKSFRSFGGSVTKSIKNADILCVSSGALKKTIKFVTAVALGKYVVDERWLVESHRKRRLLDPEPFIPKDVENEREWDFDLKAAIARGISGLDGLLSAKSIYFTRQLKMNLGANFKGFCKLAEILGAEDMGVNLPMDSTTEMAAMVIGADDDPQALIVRNLGIRLHQKDLLVMGVLRGRVDLESDDFVIRAPINRKTNA